MTDSFTISDQAWPRAANSSSWATIVATNSPAVSGPYILTAYDPDAGTAALAPNPNWWMDEGPYLDTIEFRFVPDQQVLTFIAGRISTNIRELEGALTRVVAFSSLTGRPMTVDLAQEVLKDVFPQGDMPQVSVEGIQEAVIERFGISLQELTGDRRSQSIVYPRQVAMYLCRELTDSSLPKIGKKFGVSEGRMSQLRSKFRTDWASFCGEEV